MKCEKCNTLLSPYLVKQAYKNTQSKLLFELECPNPLCRKVNIVSEAFYLKCREDIQEYEIEPSNKLPNDSNVMFVSMERCGISWIVRLLSKIHEKQFGTPIEYTPEISLQYAVKPRFPLPQGWYCVYNVSPRDVLKRKYDKVVCIRRPKEIMYRVLAMYYQTDLRYEECREQFPKYFKKIDRDYNRVYGDIEEIDDDRFLWLDLRDFNNYTVETFNFLMDHLNFPEDRPFLVPVNPPERNWQAYSTILKRDHEIGSKLKKIQERYENGMLEVLLQERQRPKEFTKKKRSTEEGRYSSVRPQKKVKIPHISKFESEVTKGRKYRVYNDDTPHPIYDVEERFKILIISPIGYGLGCHIGENMVGVFKKLGYKVSFVHSKDLKQKQLHKKELLNLSTILNAFQLEIPDFCFVNQIRTRLFNDIQVPIFYFHTGWYSEVGVLGKHIINYFRQDQLLNAYDYGERVNKVMYHAVNPETFYPIEIERIKGVHGIGYRRSWKEWDKIVGDMKPMVDLMYKETEEFKELGFHYYDTPVNDMQYRNIIKQIEAFNPIIGYGEYVSRRMLEAMACKTLIVYRLDFTINEDGSRDYSVHKDMLEGMGYYADEHYIEVKSMKDIKQKWESITEKEKDVMREKAYEVTINNHTHIHRAKQVLEDFESGVWRDAENVC